MFKTKKAQDNRDAITIERVKKIENDIRELKNKFYALEELLKLDYIEKADFYQKME